MIIESVQFAIVEGREQEFEQVMTRAREVIGRAKGFGSLEVARGVERPSVFQLLIRWDSVEDHLTGFRESEAYADWSALVRPFFAGDPLVEHFEVRLETWQG